MLNSIPRVVVLASATLITASSIQAAAITPTDLLVYRVGGGATPTTAGAAALTSAAASVWLDEYTPTGTYVQTIAAPQTGTTSLTATGNGPTEGILTLSQDHTTILLTGYRKDVGGTTPNADLPAATNRVIGRITTAGTLDTSFASTDANNVIRSATTNNNSTYYLGTAVSVRYVPASGAATTSTIIDARNTRQVQVVNDVLYASNGSTTVAAKVQSYGVNPTGTTAAQPVVTLATADAVQGFFFADLTQSIAGVDTLYLFSTIEGLLRKYTFDGTAWNASGSLTGIGSFQDLTGNVINGQANLYLTSQTALARFVDGTGYGGSLSGTLTAASTTLVTAASNTGFRGVATFVVPEPTMLAGLAGLATLAVGRRRTR